MTTRPATIQKNAQAQYLMSITKKTQQDKKKQQKTAKNQQTKNKTPAAQQERQTTPGTKQNRHQQVCIELSQNPKKTTNK